MNNDIINNIRYQKIYLIYYYLLLIIRFSVTFGSSIISKHTEVYFPKNKKGLINSIDEIIGALGLLLFVYLKQLLIIILYLFIKMMIEKIKIKKILDFIQRYLK